MDKCVIHEAITNNRCLAQLQFLLQALFIPSTIIEDERYYGINNGIQQ